MGGLAGGDSDISMPRSPWKVPGVSACRPAAPAVYILGVATHGPSEPDRREILGGEGGKFKDIIATLMRGRANAATPPTYILFLLCELLFLA